MDLETYYKLVSNENRARNYLSKKCLKNGHRFCPRCNHRKLYKLKDNRRRCKRCKYTFRDFSGRWINHGRLSCVQWLSIIKLFELEVSVRKIAGQMNLAYNTAYRAVQTIRYAILAHGDDGVDLLGG
ncbi:MAG: transposase, partial [Deltaproteobacteria bacterium]|nr:transposase [Deltaproteobacteria bacterium]MBW2149453.1 transposase [Deltaproteobacteria bacterium]